MGDDYIPTPQEAENLINGRTDAERRGNPHPFNSPAWHVWNNGYRAAMSKWTAALTDTKGDRPMGDR